MKKNKFSRYESYNILGKVKKSSIDDIKNSVITEDTKVIKSILRKCRNSEIASSNIKRFLSIILDNKNILDKVILVDDGSYTNAHVFIDQRTGYPNFCISEEIRDTLGLGWESISEMDKLNIVAEHCETLAINISRSNPSPILAIDYDYPCYHDDLSRSLMMRTYGVSILRMPIFGRVK